MNQRAAIDMDHIAQKTVGRDLSQRRVLVQVPDDLSDDVLDSVTNFFPGGAKRIRGFFHESLRTQRARKSI